MSDHRLTVLEQKLTVMQNEVSQVIGEMQNAFSSVLRANEINIRAMYARIAELEELVNNKSLPIKSKDGVEL